jgi:tetratricopeptide (TPR) repeat protein
MKNILLLLIFPVLLTGSILFFFQKKKILPALKPESITMCSSGFGANVRTDAKGKFVTALPGWGKYTYPVSNSKDSAQFYFDQGLNLYYGYHMKESLASFREAARIDPGCSMAYWGQALAMGPYYNAAHTYKMPTEVQPVLQRITQVSGSTTVKEKDLMDAMAFRYSTNTEDTRRKELNLAYAAAMKKLIEKYPDDQDIRMLYVDAVMLIHAWDFWNSNGSPKDWTAELVQLSEGTLRKNPDHPAALHYHIHLTEASHHPEVALPNADKLKNLFPGVAHMVHMSSHEYQRNGLYASGVEVNDLADKNLLLYDSLAEHLSLNKHSAHYFAVQTYCAMSGGMYETGLRDALRCRKTVSPSYENTYDQYLYMLPQLTLVRLGKWEEILKDSIVPSSEWTYASLLHHFSKGMAYVNTGRTELALKELADLRVNVKDRILEKRRIPFNAPLPIAHIAENILNASILYAQKKTDAAVTALESAIQLEDKLIYTEPNDWPLPARQFLGAILLKTGKPVEAEKIYREDLVWNPGNGWSQVGLYQSLELQKKNRQLAELKSGYKKSFSHAEAIPPASVYMKL